LLASLLAAGAVSFFAAGFTGIFAEDLGAGFAAVLGEGVLEVFVAAGFFVLEAGLVGSFFAGML
jgi:hypothetical protein